MALRGVWETRRCDFMQKQKTRIKSSRPEALLLFHFAFYVFISGAFYDDEKLSPDEIEIETNSMSFLFYLQC